MKRKHRNIIAGELVKVAKDLMSDTKSENLIPTLLDVLDEQTKTLKSVQNTVDAFPSEYSDDLRAVDRNYKKVYRALMDYASSIENLHGRTAKTASYPMGSVHKTRRSVAQALNAVEDVRMTALSFQKLLNDEGSQEDTEKVKKYLQDVFKEATDVKNQMRDLERIAKKDPFR